MASQCVKKMLHEFEKTLLTHNIWAGPITLTFVITLKGQLMCYLGPKGRNGSGQAANHSLLRAGGRNKQAQD